MLDDNKHSHLLTFREDGNSACSQENKETSNKVPKRFKTIGNNPSLLSKKTMHLGSDQKQPKESLISGVRHQYSNSSKTLNTLQLSTLIATLPQDGTTPPPVNYKNTALKRMDNMQKGTIQSFIKRRLLNQGELPTPEERNKMVEDQIKELLENREQERKNEHQTNSEGTNQ